MGNLTYVVAVRLYIDDRHGRHTIGKATILPCRDYRHAVEITNAMDHVGFECTICVELATVNYQRAFVPVNSLRYGQLDSIPSRDDMLRSDDDA